MALDLTVVETSTIKDGSNTLAVRNEVNGVGTWAFTITSTAYSALPDEDVTALVGAIQGILDAQAPA